MDVRGHLPLEELVRLERIEKDATRSKRLRIVILAIGGYTAPAIAMSVGLSRRICQRWVARYNAEGLEGLEDRRGQEPEPTLTPEQEQQVCQRLEAGPRPEDQVCSLRGVDVQRILATEFGVQRSLPAVYHLLHRLGYSYLRPRPRHRRADPQAQEEFKRLLPDRLQALREAHPGQQLRVYFQDESRFGQQGTTTNVWARRNSRPTAVRQTEYQYLWVLGAVCAENRLVPLPAWFSESRSVGSDLNGAIRRCVQVSQRHLAKDCISHREYPYCRLIRSDSMARRKGFKIPGLSFSWKRAIGLTSTRQKLARAIGVPTTRQGIKRKLGFLGLGLLGSLLTRRRGQSPQLSDESASAGGCVIATFVLAAVAMVCCGGVAVLPSLVTTVEKMAKQVATAPPRNVQPPPPSDVETISAPPITNPPENADATPTRSFSRPAISSLSPQVESPPLPVAAAPVAPNPIQRTWTSAQGNFSVEAEFTSLGNGNVKLRKTDGSEITVPIEKLSDADRKWLEDYRRSK